MIYHMVVTCAFFRMRLFLLSLDTIDVLYLVYSDLFIVNIYKYFQIVFNFRVSMNKLSIKHQSYLK